MTGKRSWPSARGPLEPLITSGGGGGEHFLLSPTSPLERDPRSPKGWKNRESGGVGLGIVAALERSGGGGGGGEFSAGKVVVGSSPISIVSPRTADKVRCFLEGYAETRDGWWRAGGATAAAARGEGEKKPSSCRGGGGGVFCGGGGEERTRTRRRELGFFCASPPRFAGDSLVFPTADFLSSCHMCGKKLHGEDIYMYRGEKAFCSMECRYRQIVIDECQEKCGPAVATADYNNYSADGGRLFYSGVAAA